MDFAGAYITNGEDILMVQEGHKEAKGLWSLPLGQVDDKESVKNCARREVQEETGYTITVSERPHTIELTGKELQSLSRFDNKLVSLHIFQGVIIGGAMKAGDDVLDVQWVSKSAVSNELTLRGQWVAKISKTISKTLS